MDIASARALLMLDKVLGKKLPYLILPPESLSEPPGKETSLWDACSAVMCVCQRLSSALLQHRAILSIAASLTENSSALGGTSAVHPAWGYAYPTLTPDPKLEGERARWVLVSHPLTLEHLQWLQSGRSWLTPELVT